eukprot:scaffold682546_cov43-Prasinocladus_malaysianus.AAC.1
MAQALECPPASRGIEKRPCADRGDVCELAGGGHKPSAEVARKAVLGEQAEEIHAVVDPRRAGREVVEALRVCKLDVVHADPGPLHEVLDGRGRAVVRVVHLERRGAAAGEVDGEVVA